MTKYKVSLGIFLLLLGIGAFACSRSETTEPKPGASPATEVAKTATPPQQPCPASASWITAPNPPTEIGGPNPPPVANETNCEFYQFAYQWFFAMTQPVGTSGERKFETLNVYQPNLKNQCALKQLINHANIGKALFVRTPKPKTNDFEPIVPKDINQATGTPLYDQNGNVVLYYVLYSPNECQATAAGYLPNTIEIKTSWRILKSADPAYYTMTATVEGLPNNPQTLGLVGFHLVINTQFHPEFVWATFEHVNNAPNCTNPQPAPAGGWSFLSSACATCLQQNGVNGCPQCKFNVAPPPPFGITGPATQVCRVFSDGTDPGSTTNGNNNDTNRFNIDTLNSQIAGFLSQLPSNSPMSVWKNYTLVSGLWTNGGVPSGGTDVQRGSLEAANTTMETFFQQPNQNCFSCHGYTTATPLTVSHIISDLLPPSIAPARVKQPK
ncbi:MAG TPA: hypothetical protein VN643_27790 [Pyrinomonadaceae bacterium]|nr:hypothetical protein [Pyrinomonadaceae bacterium]